MRNLILVPIDNVLGEHHAPSVRGVSDKERERLNNRRYELRDADTGEVIERIDI